MPTRSWVAGGLLAGLLPLVTPGLSPAAFLIDEGFEGRVFPPTGWAVTTQVAVNPFPANGDFFRSTAMTAPSGFATAGPAAGVGYALADLNDPNDPSGNPGQTATVLSVAFTVPGQALLLDLTFDYFVADPNGIGPLFAPGAPLDFTTADPNQFVTVDILADGSDPLGTGAGVVLKNLLGSDPADYPAPQFDGNGVFLAEPYTTFSTSLLLDFGQDVGSRTYVLRFGKVNNQGPLLFGVDNVRLEFIPVRPTLVPAPPGLALAAVGGLCVWARRRLRRG